LLISLIIHGIIFIFLALYVIGASTKVKEMVYAIFVPEPEPQKYEPRPRTLKPIISPSAPREQVFDSDTMLVESPKRSSGMPGRTAKTDTTLKAAGETVAQVGTSPLALAKDRIPPKVTTLAKVLPSDLYLPAAVAGGTPGQGGKGKGMGTGEGGMGAGRGGGRQASAAIIKAPPQKQTLSIVRQHNVATLDESLADVAKGVRLGPSRVPPIPKGEPGGVVIGRGSDIEGHIRFTRIKHYLADWWADPTSMPAVMYWMNNQTKIKADMNIEGGALKFDDPKLMKCPLAIMTGHDRNILVSSNLKGNYRGSLTQSERVGLRQYLIEARGFLFFDECGHDLMLANLLKSELRAAMPEHDVEWIPKDHGLYNCYYKLGGPPPGACQFWKHGYRWSNQTGKPLEGIFIGGELAVVISTRDYLCSARTKNRPGHGSTGESNPAGYRFLTNMVIYSLTHGNISEHSDYIPEMTDADRISIDAPVKVPVLMPE